MATTADIWVVRRGDHVIVRCNQTLEEFHLTCVGQTWIGDLGNCSIPGISVLDALKFVFPVATVQWSRVRISPQILNV